MTLVFTLMLEIRSWSPVMTQPDDHITVSEGAHLELKCSYSSSVSPYLFWYVQYPDQGFQLLLKYMSGDNLVSGIRGFEAEFRKSEKSFHLRKTPAHWKDSAKYFCALSDTVPGAAGGAEPNLLDTVAQHKGILPHEQEDEECTILSGSGWQVLLQNRVGEGEETN
ncbi:hypothetical protein FD754_024347 [Muntiacus muntjak]|uniref:Ig-like domain-containing protein n=1 Tax=Muntiacus muntjak TaxID=9888 RepID=A0A5N3UQ44_MUNMU|nr:hypothetical protein FD754_024347 [Muntiacus muntjak]